MTVRWDADVPDHYNLCTVEVIVNYAAPSQTIRRRGEQLTAKPKLRLIWNSGRLTTPSTAPETDQDVLALWQHIGRQGYRQMLRDPLTTMARYRAHV